MKLSKKFLNDFIDIENIDYHELADKMVLVGNEYESIKRISEATNVVVGYIKECRKHPESTKLSICKVDIGDKVVQILCGAPNVKQDQYVAVAKVGAILPGNVEIKKAQLAGMESNGMICALDELGIDSKYLTEEDKTGIHPLMGIPEIGEDAIKYLGYDDEVIDFELTANRGDLLSIRGMAYEVGAIYGKEVKLPDTKVEEIKDNIKDEHTLTVKTDNCSIYLAKKVKNIKIMESPNFIKSRLMASGIRPINNVVDISNYVMLEYGQPLHFFDADKIGRDVIVRMANQGETLVTLDGKERTLSDRDIVIANPEGAVGLAGVMGGLNTEITSDTNSIFIESAIFDPIHIRNTSKEILRSEASNRYEKGIDPNGSLLAINRACYLLHKYAEGEVVSDILVHDKANKEDKIIAITLNKINNILGMDLETKEVEKIFKDLGFESITKNNTFKVSVPTRRLDINIEEDLIEEVGRLYGYENLVGKQPITSIKQGSYSRKDKMVKMIRTRLEALNLNQVITYSLVSEKEADQFDINNHEKIVISNPMSEDKKIMRVSLIPSLLSVFKYNLARNIKDINLFEIASSYYKKDDKYVEETLISGLMYNHYYTNNHQNKIIKTDFYVLKGVIENLLNYLGLNNRYQFKIEQLPSELHPGRSVNVMLDNELIGFIGQVHPQLSKKEVYVFELSLDKLMTKKVREIKYKELSKYPDINKDIAFLIDRETPALDIINVIKRAGGRMLANIDVFDVYEGDNISDNQKSIAFALTFSDSSRTLTEEEINVVLNKIINEVETKLKAKLRTK
ncbi:MAG: phenylalanine--tRNA ligase subunit beta [Bacilli bacterium]|nr:phenylalanine--tRNA ligase subunit beta [Bacilli bacterium]MDD4809113.1 phenylalanine--tRNA ligase subunit beta [Bacilli bacterium]